MKYIFVVALLTPSLGFAKDTKGFVCGLVDAGLPAIDLTIPRAQMQPNPRDPSGATNLYEVFVYTQAGDMSVMAEGAVDKSGILLTFKDSKNRKIGSYVGHPHQPTAEMTGPFQLKGVTDAYGTIFMNCSGDW